MCGPNIARLLPWYGESEKDGIYGAGDIVALHPCRTAHITQEERVCTSEATDSQLFLLLLSSELVGAVLYVFTKHCHFCCNKDRAKKTVFYGVEDSIDLHPCRLTQPYPLASPRSKSLFITALLARILFLVY